MANPTVRGRPPLNSGVRLMTEQGSSLPFVFCDLNARMTETGYALTNGSIACLSALGLTPEAATGRSFRFGDGDLMFFGTIESHQFYGFLAQAKSPVVNWLGPQPILPS